MTDEPAEGIEAELENWLSGLQPSELGAVAAALIQHANELRAKLPKEARITDRVSITDTVTVEIRTSWKVHVPAVTGTGTSNLPPAQGSGTGTFTYTGSAVGVAPPLDSPAVAAAHEHLKRLLPQNNTELLASLDWLWKRLQRVALLIVLLNPPPVAQEILASLEEAFGIVIEVVKDEPAPETPAADEPTE